MVVSTLPSCLQHFDSRLKSAQKHSTTQPDPQCSGNKARKKGTEPFLGSDVAKRRENIGVHTVRKGSRGCVL